MIQISKLMSYIFERAFYFQLKVSCINCSSNKQTKNPLYSIV